MILINLLISPFNCFLICITKITKTEPLDEDELEFIYNDKMMDDNEILSIK